ncbi:hypothetical protein FPOAC2_13161 [Fusarium poae]
MEPYIPFAWDDTDNGTWDNGQVLFGPAGQEVDTLQDAHMQSEPRKRAFEMTGPGNAKRQRLMREGEEPARSESTLPPSFPQPQPGRMKPDKSVTDERVRRMFSAPPKQERVKDFDTFFLQQYPLDSLARPSGLPWASKERHAPVKKPRGRPRKTPPDDTKHVNPQRLTYAPGKLPPPQPIPDGLLLPNGYESQIETTNGQDHFPFEQDFSVAKLPQHPEAYGPGLPAMNEIPFDFRAVSSMKYYMAKQRLERKHSILDAIDADTLAETNTGNDVLAQSKESLDSHEETWNGLSWGVKWVILWILNKTNRFAKIVTLILHLGHRQVHEFIEQYIRQYLFWETWKEHVERIPHAALLEHALEKRQTVAELLQQYRPLLYTEQITRQDEEKGAGFLFSLGQPGVVEEFKALMNEKLTGFLRLDIEWDFIQEVIDKQQILASVGLRWLNPEAVGRAIMRSLPQEDMKQKSGLRNPLTKITLFGSTKDDGQDSNMSQNESEPTDNDQTSQTNKQPVAEARDEEAYSESLPFPEAPLLSLLPGPHGRQAIPAHQKLLKVAIHRTAPESYGTVQGVFASKLVSTLVEEERGPLPIPSAYRPRGFPFYAKHVPGIAGYSNEDLVGEVHPGTTSQNGGLTDRQLMRHDALSARGRAFTQIAERPATQNGRNGTGHYRESGLNRVINAPVAEHTVSAPSSGRLNEREEPPTPSKQLRQMLEKYNGFLTETNQEEKSASSDSDDEAAMDISDIALPEPENDEEYCPKKKSSRKPPKKKATSVRKVGRPRKASIKKNDTTQKNAEGLQGHGGQIGAGLESNTQDSFNAQKTPTKEHTRDGPPSSGPPSSSRRKIIIRQSQTPTPAEPSNPEPGVTIPRQDHPTPTRATIPRAKHAVSAKYATYASMSTHARFAQTAIHSAKGVADLTTITLPNNVADPSKLTLEFSKIKRCGKQNVDRAEFAWKAERAEFAGTAFVAEDALQVLGKEQGDAKGISE